MRTGRDQQPLSYDVRLPDEAQADTLRLLDVTRQVVNAALVLLWPHLDEFMQERRGPAWKQVVALIDSPAPHGDRQWRCEAETAGRIMRAQAARKQVFQTIQPILTDSFIRPKEENRPAAKNRKSIKEAITELQKSLEDDDTGFVSMQNVVEQCCNYYFAHDCFPATYEELQPLPRLSVGLLTFAGDDGGAKLEVRRDRFPEGDRRREPAIRKLAVLRRELDRCWHKYELRNQTLAHLAANVLLLLCAVHGCSLLCMESLKTLKSTGRGKGVRGRWLWCENPTCGWNGDRDYAAALNLARLGITFLTHLQRTHKAQAFKMTDPLVKPVSYTGAGAVLLLPPTGPRTRPTSSGKVYYPGWTRSAFLQSSSSKETFLRLCG